MGSLEMMLLMKYGIPLAIKLLSEGKDDKETIDAANTAIGAITSGHNAGDVLIGADEQQTNDIVNGLYGVLTGVTGAFGGLVKSLGNLFKK
jgi:hypothetical protein